MNLGSVNEAQEFKDSLEQLDKVIKSFTAILIRYSKGTFYYGVKDNGEFCHLTGKIYSLIQAIFFEGCPELLMKPERTELILRYMHTRQLVTVEDLMQLTASSASTVRRELARLAHKGTIVRVHGGASLARYVPVQPTTDEKAVSHHEEKARIGAAAAAMIREGDSAVIDAGTTAIEMARAMQNVSSRIFTPDLHVALELLTLPKIQVTVTGGMLDRSSQSCVGTEALHTLNSISPALCFIACNAWDCDGGVQTPDPLKQEFKQALVKRRCRRVLIADSSKYGATSLYKVCDLTDLDAVITDSGLPPDEGERIRRCGCELIIV